MNSAVINQDQYNNAQYYPVVAKYLETVFLYIADEKFYRQQGHNKGNNTA